MQRRGFLLASLAAFAAPAIVHADSLMRLAVPRLVLWGDGVHDDTQALQNLLAGLDVRRPDGASLLRSYADNRTIYLPAGTYKIRGAKFKGESTYPPGIRFLSNGS